MIINNSLIAFKLPAALEEQIKALAATHAVSVSEILRMSVKHFLSLPVNRDISEGPPGAPAKKRNFHA